MDNNKKTKDIGLSANKGRPRHTDKQTEGKKSKETKEQEIKRQVGRETDKKNRDGWTDKLLDRHRHAIIQPTYVGVIEFASLPELSISSLSTEI